MTIEGFSVLRPMVLIKGDNSKKAISEKEINRNTASSVVRGRENPLDLFLKYKIAATAAPKAKHNNTNQKGNPDII